MPVMYKVLRIHDNQKETVCVMVQTTYVRNGEVRRGHCISYDIKRDSLPASVEEINNNPDMFVAVRRYKHNPTKIIRRKDDRE